MYDIVLLEKSVDEGINKKEVTKVMKLVNGYDVLPFEVQNPNGSSVATGFVSYHCAEKYDFNLDAITRNLESVLENMNLESPTSVYRIDDTNIYMGRSI